MVFCCHVRQGTGPANTTLAWRPNSSHDSDASDRCICKQLVSRVKARHTSSVVSLHRCFEGREFRKIVCNCAASSSARVYLEERCKRRLLNKCSLNALRAHTYTLWVTNIPSDVACVALRFQLCDRLVLTNRIHLIHLPSRSALLF